MNNHPRKDLQCLAFYKMADGPSAPLFHPPHLCARPPVHRKPRGSNTLRHTRRRPWLTTTLVYPWFMFRPFDGGSILENIAIWYLAYYSNKQCMYPALMGFPRLCKKLCRRSITQYESRYRGPPVGYAVFCRFASSPLDR
jgi:hypothetical protein